MKRVDVVSALVDDGFGNLLIVKNVAGNSSYWGPPGGAVEEGETLEQAVIREVKEETGYDIIVTGLSSIREAFMAERGHHVLFVTFYAKVVNGSMTIEDPDHDIAEVKWADRQTVQELMPTLLERLKIDTDQDKTPAFYAYEGIR